MKEPSWADLEAMFHEALACAPADRAAFLTERCAGRPDLQAEVEALLRAHEGAASGAWEMPSVAPQTRLKAGARVGPYEVLAQLGAGGMGEVYRAHDRKLGRDVAIKVLPTIFTSDAERLGRFEREARVLAALNHPNIAVIYGIEDANGAPALVLELIDGVTLAARLARPMPVTEALTIARQIADALEAAHEKGIIHRDLKPANIKITSAGVVKVLDFGLAKVGARDGTAPDLSQSPTVTAGGTREGMILGTVAYMSPEQARGQVVDKRSDIWAFGCVLYEMLTGRRAFPGDDWSDTLVGILRGDPDWHALPASTPAAIRRLLRRCLAKERKERLPDIAVARLDIVEVLTSPDAPLDAAPAPPRRPLRVWHRPLSLVTGIVVLLGVTLFGFWALTRPAPPRVTRLTITPSGAAALGIIGGIAISPDGTRLAYVGTGPQQIFVRAFDQLEPTALQGVGATGGLFFSPDGQWIGFFDGVHMLKKVAATGGPPVTVSRTTGGNTGASWSTDDTIIFSTYHPPFGLLRVAAGGGEPEVLTTPNRDQGELEHRSPQVLPGGQAVLFTITTGGAGLENGQIAVLDLTTRERKTLIRGGSHARYVPTGHLVYYGVGGTLWAVAFDLRRREVVGTPVPVLEQVMTTPGWGVQLLSISSDGTLVYVPGGVQAPTFTLVWVDRQGREEPIKAPPRFINPRLSPDGTRVALTDDADIWIWALARETLTRFTFDPGEDQHPIWTPDGRRVLFNSTRAGPADNLFWQASDGTGAVERLTESPNKQYPYSVSPDGTRLVFREETATTGADLMVLALEGGRPSARSARSGSGEPVEPRRAQPPSPGVGGPGRSATSGGRPLVQTTFDEQNGEISPGGRWVAYQSNESGQDEIYVRPFPDANSGRWQVSTGGGTRPLWARSGKELFYLGPSGAVMSVAVEGGSTFRAGTPTRLFEGPYFMIAASWARTYDVSPDGQRFLMIKVGGASNETPAPTSIIVVQNWTEELKRLVLTK